MGGIALTYPLKQIYTLAVAGYDAAKLPPVQFLPKKKAWLEQELEILRKQIELQALEGEIVSFAHQQ